LRTEDTIVAIATPLARGGLGVVRLSGARAADIAAQIVRPLSKRAPGGGSVSDGGAGAEVAFRPWRVHAAQIVDTDGAVVDEVLVSYFRRPHSYTAEDVVEISCHGAPVVLRYVVERCLSLSARLAEPGEFTLRAFLNGRIDLTQAEAVRELVDAQTLYQAKVAAQQVEGAVAHWICPWKKQLLDLIAQLEAGIDFAEDDVSVLTAEEIEGRLAGIEQGLCRIAESFQTGRVIHDGLTLAIVGRPNVGKSSLFNRLIQQDRAIVTAAPGTTRDLVAETVDIEGIPLRFIDTAGVRAASDEAESLGVKKSYQAAADSDVSLLVLDATCDIAEEDRDLFTRLFSSGKLLVVVNKCDQPARLTESLVREQLFALAGEPAGAEAHRIVFTSALTGEGIPEVKKAVLNVAAPAFSGSREPQFLTSVRQRKLVADAAAALAQARRANAENLPHEILLIDLYSALRHLDAMTGDTTTEDVLGQIFSHFCIGK